jgi:heterodisulfide reductase subunit A
LTDVLKAIGSITIIGGGIAGIQAALDAANAGYKVHLIEEKPVVGGAMAQLDKTFPTNDCSSCMMGPKLVELANHPNIEILAYTDVLKIDGDPGHFHIILKKKARAIDAEKCIGCGLCVEKCPERHPDPFNLGLNDRKAVYIPYPQAVPLVYTIDKETCRFFTKGKCRICEKICPVKAVDFDQKDEIIEIETGAVILSGGYEAFNPSHTAQYGHGRWPNVVTSLEYERILSAAGPFGGHIQRISDGKPPRRIAWILCVGSRDSHLGQDYCSSVCCMNAIKQAMITKEHDAEAETTIFYIDIRAYGKGFDRYFERAQIEDQVRFVRSMVSRVVPNPEDDTLQITFTSPDHRILEETFDMVVLAIGLCASSSTQRLAEEIGLGMNNHGFCVSDPLEMVNTTRSGIYVCGVAQGPKDIPDSVQQASSASANAMRLLSASRGTLIEERTRPVERDVMDEDPRIGVYICHCGMNIAGVVDVKAVTEYTLSLPDVAYATDCIFACSTDQQEDIKRAISEHGLNRIVVASCTSRTHESLFQDTLRQAGLNPYLFELANIREHDAWVHRAEPEAATRKAADLIGMSVARARLLKPLPEKKYTVIQRALVIGGGLAGLTAALDIAELGYEAALVEKTSELGGNALTLYSREDGANPAQYVQKLIEKLKNEPRVTVYTNAEITEIRGVEGDFTTTVLIGDDSIEINHGVTVVATGGEEYKPDEYLYGKHSRVLTQKEFESILVSHPEEAEQLRNVVMIQCVGSREPYAPYCSRVCCTAAVKNSLTLKSLNPASHISILYRDIRTFGFRETFYREARFNGVRFYRYDSEQKPDVKSENGTILVSIFDQQLQKNIQLKADFLVLSTAIRPGPQNRNLSETLHLPLDQDGFFMEAHPKLRPLDFLKAGFFLCGLAQGPKFSGESIAQAHGAVSRAMSVLSKTELVAQRIITNIDQKLCRACGECEKVCLFDAIHMKENENKCKAAVVTRSLCTGCGACNVACPTGAASLSHFQDDQIIGVIKHSFAV